MENAKSSAIPKIPELKRNKTGRFYAPHKPVLLLAIVDLVEAGEINQPRFEVTDSLIEAFTLEWKRHVPLSGIFVAKPWNPIHHIEDEIVHRQLRPGKDPARYATSVQQCKEFYEYLELNNELFSALQTAENRAYLRNQIVAAYLSDSTPMGATIPFAALLTMTISQLLAG